jgi:2-oxo-4-hydroxy-4-carboxy--5-ureidoimidazoline (OHCU) decarboxylase
MMRRFYRQKYDVAKVIAEFAATCRDETDLDKLTARLVEVVQKTMQPTQVSLWLKPVPGVAGKREMGREKLTGAKPDASANLQPLA